MDSTGIDNDSLSAAMDFLDATVAYYDYENNLKQTLSLFITHTNSTIGFSDNEKSYIDSVSLLCPYTEGQGVYYARGLKEIYNGAAYYNDSLLCILNQGIPKTNKTNKQPETKLEIYPNPASNEIYYLTSTNEKAALYLTISNGYGEEIINRQVSSHEMNKIDVSQLANGLYYVYLRSAEKRIALNKLVITR